MKNSRPQLLGRIALKCNTVALAEAFPFLFLRLAEMSARIPSLKLHIPTTLWSMPAISRARPHHHHHHVPLRNSTSSAPPSRFSSFQIATPRLAFPSTPTCSTSASTVTVSDVNVDTVDLSEFVLTGAKVTSVAHGVWRKVVRPGDTVIDATCGNGHDTLELARLVCADNAPGYVYAFDVQEEALGSSSYLLDERLDSVQRKRVKLLRLCHSQLEKIVGETEIRLVTFNLGYLPGGDHDIVTNIDTTVQALQASSNVLQPGGLISVVAYVGHPGGREEFEAVMKFAANLPSHVWVCSQHEWVNRPRSPRLILMLKK